jgi:hypothetical protein
MIPWGQGRAAGDAIQIPGDGVSRRSPVRRLADHRRVVAIRRARRIWGISSVSARCGRWYQRLRGMPAISARRDHRRCCRLDAFRDTRLRCPLATFNRAAGRRPRDGGAIQAKWPHARDFFGSSARSWQHQGAWTAGAGVGRRTRDSPSVPDPGRALDAAGAMERAGLLEPRAAPAGLIMTAAFDHGWWWAVVMGCTWLSLACGQERGAARRGTALMQARRVNAALFIRSSGRRRP